MQTTCVCLCVCLGGLDGDNATLIFSPTEIHQEGVCVLLMLKVGASIPDISPPLGHL